MDEPKAEEPIYGTLQILPDGSVRRIKARLTQEESQAILDAEWPPEDR